MNEGIGQNVDKFQYVGTIRHVMHVAPLLAGNLLHNTVSIAYNVIVKILLTFLKLVNITPSMICVLRVPPI